MKAVKLEITSVITKEKEESPFFLIRVAFDRFAKIYYTGRFVKDYAEECVKQIFPKRMFIYLGFPQNYSYVSFMLTEKDYSLTATEEREILKRFANIGL